MKSVHEVNFPTPASLLLLLWCAICRFSSSPFVIGTTLFPPSRCSPPPPPLQKIPSHRSNTVATAPLLIMTARSFVLPAACATPDDSGISILSFVSKTSSLFLPLLFCFFSPAPNLQGMMREGWNMDGWERGKVSAGTVWRAG